MMILENIAALARPVRIAANCSLACSTARSIFSSASRRVSSITGVVASFNSHYGPCPLALRLRSAGGDQCSDLLPADGAHDGLGALRGEHDHRQLVVVAEAERGRVDHPQPLAQR